MLGSSETIGGFPELFAQADRKNRIYAKRLTRTRLNYGISTEQYPAEKAAAGRLPGTESFSVLDVRKAADNILLNQYAPAGVLINDDLEILQYRGHTGHFLEPPPGEATHNLAKMVREGLLLDLHAAIYEARKKNTTVTKERTRVKSNGGFKQVNLKVTPIQASPTERYFLILFEEAAPAQTDRGRPASKSKTKAPAKQPGHQPELLLLQEELDVTRKYLQSIIEEQEETNIELRSANEEILSANEELQSTNEELETAKEELQATNEELTTVNEELHNRNHELNLVNDDLNNLLGSNNIPLIILGNDLRIRRFTAQAGKVMNLIPGDVGRPFNDLKPHLQLADLETQIQQVIDTITASESEVQDYEGHWYSMRLRPYRTTDNRIDGVVMILVDIDALKRSQRQLKEALEYSAAIVDTVREALLVLDGGLKVHSANRSFYQKFQTRPDQTIGRHIYELGNGQWNIPQLRTLLEELLPRDNTFENFSVNHAFPNIGLRKMLLNARKIERADSDSPLILLAIEEFT